MEWKRTLHCQKKALLTFFWGAKLDFREFELKLRDALGEWHEGREVTDDLVREFYVEFEKSGLPFNKWANKILDACFDCDQDCSRCQVPAVRL